VRGRTAQDGMPPSGLCISSPSDVEARYGKQHPTSWGGDTVQVTETCEDEAPHRMPPVETTAGPVSAGAATPHIHPALARQGLWPTTPLGDTGSRDADLWGTSPRADRGDRLGPLRADGHWPARAAPGVAASHCQSDGEPQRATCPGGSTSVSWTPAVEERTTEVVQSKCSMQDCQLCARRVHGPRATRRPSTGRRQDHHVAWHAARARDTSAA
jgi:transposase